MPYPRHYNNIYMDRTEISSLGEFAFIDRLTKEIKLNHKSSKVGIGDDAAVIEQETGFDSLLTTDLFLEGVHFDLVYTPLKHLGYKCLVATIADIYAMNGEPKQVSVSIGLSARFSVEDIEELYAGIELAGSIYGVDIVAGDTSASQTGLLISMSCLGVVKTDEACLRSGAKPTDLICCTGDLGAAYMGLALLEREKKVFAGETEAFEAKGIKPTSMIDISDGLASELLHICKSSKVGVRIYEERLPIDYETAQMAEELELNTTTVALNGGDDYEFLFTLPLGLMDKAKEIEGLRFIGHITEESLGASLVTRDGSEISLKAQGWK